MRHDEGDSKNRLLTFVRTQFETSEESPGSMSLDCTCNWNNVEFNCNILNVSLLEEEFTDNSFLSKDWRWLVSGNSFRVLVCWMIKSGEINFNPTSMILEWRAVWLCKTSFYDFRKKNEANVFIMSEQLPQCIPLNATSFDSVQFQSFSL